MRRRVTFSRNLTLSLSRTCRCYCKYCSFATHTGASVLARGGARDPRRGGAQAGQGAARADGRAPEVNPEVARAPARSTATRTSPRTSCGPASGRSSAGLLPHTNLGVLAREDLARLREVTASQGLMLESVSERLMETVHAGSPTKHPARRLETIRAAGELRIPFTSGILVGHRRDRAGAHGIARGARRGARRARAHPGGDPAELRPPPALLRPGARADRRRGRARVLAHRRRRTAGRSCRCPSGPAR